jgi:hypothetical protein
LIAAAAIDVRVLIPGHRRALVANMGPAAPSSARHGGLFARSVQAKIVHCSKSRPGYFLLRGASSRAAVARINPALQQAFAPHQCTITE